MTFQEFLEKYNGKYIDFDGVYGAQCMDLLHIYIVEVLGLLDGNILAAPAAKDVYNNFDNLTGQENFERIPNTPEGVPIEGDIVLWGNGTWGHVAIFIDGDINKFNSFDQNYPTGSPCHIQSHSYTNVLGWLRCKNVSIQAELDKTRGERDRNWTWFAGLCDLLGVSPNFDVAKAELEKLIGIEDKLHEKEQQLQEANTKIVDLENKVKLLEEQHIGLEDDNTKLNILAQEQAKTIQVQGTELKVLQNELQSVKDGIESPSSGWELIKKGLLKLLK